MCKKGRLVGDVWVGKDGKLFTLNENHHVERYWTPNELELLKANYARTPNEELSKDLMLPITAIMRKAKKLGLKKDFSYFFHIHKDKLVEGRRKSNKKPHGNIHSYIARETAEQRKARLERSATTRKNLSTQQKYMQKKRLQETMSLKTDEERAQKSRKISDSWKDPQIRERRIAKLKETLANRTAAKKMVTNYLISQKRKAFFANETESEKNARCEKMKQLYIKRHEERNRAM